ncbi:MAG TPA: hypothetical protein VHO02_06065, partial [Fibrobacteria bacterium]|nr:hypothetical protein [Fibrobacteria bacterium]
AIRAVEAGTKLKPDSVAAQAAKAASRKDSLRAKLERRGPYVGLSVGIAFGEHSAADLFSNYMNAQATANGQRILQRQDPVHVFFPVGLVLGYPLPGNFDVVLRTESFYYKVTGLAQKDNDSPTEFWYANQAHLGGLGARWLVPLSLFTVDGRAGLYAGYTRFWNFGPTGIKSSSGSVRARTEPAGAGYEIQLGFQQDFDKRWTYSGGLSMSRLSFESDGDWSHVIPAASGPASWSLNSVRFAFQGLYQFGRK